MFTVINSLGKKSESTKSFYEFFMFLRWHALYGRGGRKNIIENHKKPNPPVYYNCTSTWEFDFFFFKTKCEMDKILNRNKLFCGYKKEIQIHIKELRFGVF